MGFGERHDVVDGRCVCTRDRVAGVGVDPPARDHSTPVQDGFVEAVRNQGLVAGEPAVTIEVGPAVAVVLVTVVAVDLVGSGSATTSAASAGRASSMAGASVMGGATVVVVVAGLVVVVTGTVVEVVAGA